MSEAIGSNEVEKNRSQPSLVDRIIGFMLIASSLVILVMYLYLTLTSPNSLGSTGVLLKTLSVIVIVMLYSSIAWLAYSLLLSRRS